MDWAEKCRARHKDISTFACPAPGHLSFAFHSLYTKARISCRATNLFSITFYPTHILDRDLGSVKPYTNYLHGTVPKQWCTSTALPFCSFEGVNSLCLPQTCFAPVWCSLTHDCSVINGHWSEWSDGCSMTCTQTHTCINPKHDGKPCSEYGRSSRPCKKNCTPCTSTIIHHIRVHTHQLHIAVVAWRACLIMFIEDEIPFTPVYTRNQSSRCTCVIAAWPLIGGLGAAVLAVVVIVVVLLLWRKHKKQRTIAGDGSLHVDLLPPVAESLEDSISQHDSAEYNAPQEVVGVGVAGGGSSIIIAIRGYQVGNSSRCLFA